jgi:1-acyl-sn-glycerol-3-phosphate acyltransferase
MLTRMRYGLQGVIVLLAVSVSTVVLTTVIAILAIFKLIASRGRAKNAMTRWLSSLGETWVSINKSVVWFYRDLEFDVQLPRDISHQGRYLVFCNHQSAVDILILQHCLNRRAPFGRFLLKQELIWVPVLGVAWWALDMAFLSRYSRQQLLKEPGLRSKDLENTARACEKLKHIPVSMMTFPEGTRFSKAKRDRQKSPYKHLLMPRYGGIGQVLYSFDDALHAVIDVTIFYPDGPPSVWQYASGQVGKISINVQLRLIEEGIRGGDMWIDEEAHQQLQAWLNGIWEEKEQFISHAIDKQSRSDSIKSNN